MTYLQYMNNIILSQKDEVLDKYINIMKFPSCERNGVDQGVHNVLLYKGYYKYYYNCYYYNIYKYIYNFVL